MTWDRVSIRLLPPHYHNHNLSRKTALPGIVGVTSDGFLLLRAIMLHLTLQLTYAMESIIDSRSSTKCDTTLIEQEHNLQCTICAKRSHWMGQQQVTSSDELTELGEVAIRTR